MHRYAAYRRMYRSMSEAIAAGAGGDSLRSLRQSGHGVLAAEEALTGAAALAEGQFRPVGHAGARP